MRIFKLGIITLFISFSLFGCANNGIYRSLVVHPQVKEMVNKLLDKKIKFKSLQIKKEEYEDSKSNLIKKDYSNVHGYIYNQNIIDNLKGDDIVDVKYFFSSRKSIKLRHTYKVIITYLKRQIDTSVKIESYFTLWFMKSDDDDYFLVRVENPIENDSDDIP